MEHKPPLPLLDTFSFPPEAAAPRVAESVQLGLIPPTPISPTTLSPSEYDNSYHHEKRTPSPPRTLRHRLPAQFLKLKDSFHHHHATRPGSEDGSLSLTPSSTLLAPSPSPSPPSSTGSHSTDRGKQVRKSTSLSSLTALMSLAPAVKLVLVNQTGLKVEVVEWPVVASYASASGGVSNGDETIAGAEKVKEVEGDKGMRMQTFKGDGVLEGLTLKPWVEREEEVVELGRMRRPERKGWENAHSTGWLFFDLLLPSPASTASTSHTHHPDLSEEPYRLHLQTYLRLSTSGSWVSRLSLFDLDSSISNPSPGASVGRVEIIRSTPTHHNPFSSASSTSIKELKELLPHHHRRESSVEYLPSNIKKDVGEGEVVEVRYFLTKDVRELVNEVDDSTKLSGKLLGFSKGLVVGTWVTGKDTRVSLLINKEARYHEPPHPYLAHRHHLSHPHHSSAPHAKSGLHLHLQHSNPSQKQYHKPSLKVSHHILDGFESKHCYILISHRKEIIFERGFRVNPVDGKVTGSKLASTIETPSIVDHDRELITNYGFFDAGLTKAKQAYVYVTELHSSWLTELITTDPRVLEVPFDQLALAGSHDAGMLGRINPLLLNFIQRGVVDNDVPKVATALPLLRFVMGLLKVFNVRADRILANMAITQKDNIRTQLEMGVRFFDFRPGYCLYDSLAGVQGALHHQHSIVPGVRYDSFLVDILNFLGDHPSEIVVFEIKSDGFPFTADITDLETGGLAAISMVPSLDSLQSSLAHAIESSSSSSSRSIQIGSTPHLARPIGSLLATNTRLIIIDRVHNPPGTEGCWERADSYTHESYDTDDPGKILKRLDEVNEDAGFRAAKGEGESGTIYQLQATPTAQIWADVGASLTYSDASSLLVWSKARMDRVTYPWIASKTFVERGLVVFLNDFVDGALVDHAIGKCRDRTTIWLAKKIT